MSKYETRDNTGALFKNLEKTNERGPDYSGTCMVNGVEMFFDAWPKVSESGRKWLSFSFKVKQKQPQHVPEKSFGNTRRPDPSMYDDDIPF